MRFIYVGDPMCSWCWGFAPTVEAIQERYEFALDIVVGGLRPGPAAEPLDSLRPFLTKHWIEIEERTGQPFDLAGLNRQDWMYDTEMPARAVVAVRDKVPDLTLAVFVRIQRAFYAEAIDVTDAAVYGALFADVGAEKALDLFRSEDSKRLAWQDFSLSRSWGIGGFPSLLVEHDEQLQIVTRGYMAPEALLPALDTWVHANVPRGATGLT